MQRLLGAEVRPARAGGPSAYRASLREVLNGRSALACGMAHVELFRRTDRRRRTAGTDRRRATDDRSSAGRAYVTTIKVVGVGGGRHQRRQPHGRLRHPRRRVHRRQHRLPGAATPATPTSRSTSARRSPTACGGGGRPRRRPRRRSRSRGPDQAGAEGRRPGVRDRRRGRRHRHRRRAGGRAVARELGALTVAIVTRPFAFEGTQARAQAHDGIDELSAAADTVIVIPNDRLLQVVERTTSIVEAFRYADDILRQGVQGICDLITVPGLINLDFADVRTIIKDAGTALLGIGGAGGENRANEAARHGHHARRCSRRSINGARGILLNITGGSDLSLYEVNEAAEIVAGRRRRRQHHLRRGGRPGAHRSGVGHRRCRQLQRRPRRASDQPRGRGARGVVGATRDRPLGRVGERLG